MSPTLFQGTVAANVVTLNARPPTQADAQPSIAGKQPDLPRLGSLSPPNARALGKAMAGERLAGLPALGRVGKLVNASERGAIQQLRRGAGARVVLPELTIPLATAGGAEMRGLFPRGAELVRTRKNGAAPLQNFEPTKESLAAIESAFTPQRIGAFSALSAEQKVLARSVLADLLPSLQSGAISEAEFDTGVGLVLEAAGRYAPPSVPAARALSATDAPANTATKPPTKPVVPETPEGVSAETPVPAQAVAVARSVAPAGTAPAWSDERIRDAVNALAQQRGITRASLIGVMTDILQHPDSSVAQRSARLGQAEQPHSTNVSLIYKSLNLPTEKGKLRIRLAELIGMLLGAVVSRIGSESDPQLGSRVIGRIAPSHREDVARRLLSVMPGSERELDIYRMLDTMFTSDPFRGEPPGSTTRPVFALHALFSNDRIEMLRMMGFNAEQILSMNPVGHELAKRIDPAMGTYSPAEAAARKAKGLPTTREEVAMRLMTARSAAGKSLSYRQWVAVGLLSDKPWSLPQDLNNAYLSVSPGGSPTAGQSDATFAFHVAKQILGKEIPRGPQEALMDRGYREDINRQMLMLFGLGATSLFTGRLESIPTAFMPRDRPNASETGERSPARVTNKPGGVDQVGWEELVRLLRPPAK